MQITVAVAEPIDAGGHPHRLIGPGDPARLGKQGDLPPALLTPAGHPRRRIFQHPGGRFFNRNHALPPFPDAGPARRFPGRGRHALTEVKEVPPRAPDLHIRWNAHRPETTRGLQPRPVGGARARRVRVLSPEREDGLRTRIAHRSGFRAAPV
ncbi:hypothetical protein GCM10023334_115900 [Nonomuraea thailandensis]